MQLEHAPPSELPKLPLQNLLHTHPDYIVVKGRFDQFACFLTQLCGQGQRFPNYVYLF
jgi:hypothetical protein